MKKEKMAKNKKKVENLRKILIFKFNFIKNF